MSSFGIKLKNIREQRGETQDHIAKMLKISRTSISKYESGDREPDIEMIKILSNHYGVSVDYILGLSDDLGFYKNMSETSDTDYIHENITSYINPFNQVPPEIEQLIKDEKFIRLAKKIKENQLDINEIENLIDNILSINKG